MYIFDYDLNDLDLEYNPDDIYDFEFWINVNIGDGVAGNYYQVHICTPISIKGIRDKRNIFMVDQWKGLSKLIEHMNEFIKKEIDKSSTEDPYIVLSKCWHWEYEGMH